MPDLSFDLRAFFTQLSCPEVHSIAHFNKAFVLTAAHISFHQEKEIKKKKKERCHLLQFQRKKERKRRCFFTSSTFIFFACSHRFYTVSPVNVLLCILFTFSLQHPIKFIEKTLKPTKRCTNWSSAVTFSY